MQFKKLKLLLVLLVLSKALLEKLPESEREGLLTFDGKCEDALDVQFGYICVCVVLHVCSATSNNLYNEYLQPSAFRRPSSLLPVCRVQKAFASKMSLYKSRAMLV